MYFYFYLHMCVSVCGYVNMYAGAPKAREGLRAPGAVVKTVVSLLMWVPNFGPLEEEGLC